MHKLFERALSRYKEGGPGSGRKGHKTDKPKSAPKARAKMPTISIVPHPKDVSDLTPEQVKDFKDRMGHIGAPTKFVPMTRPGGIDTSGAVVKSLDYQGKSKLLTLEGPDGKEIKLDAKQSAKYLKDQKHQSKVDKIKRQHGGKESEASPFTGPTVGKLAWANVFTWAKPLLTMEAANKNQTVVKAQPESPLPEGASASEEVNAILIQNPEMNASTLINTLKAKGFEIVDKKGAMRKGVEADSASANAPALRGKETKESKGLSFRGSLRMLESAASDNGIGPTRFKSILIQEGLGNLRDCYYYTKEALQSAAAIFEGKKVYADHPSAIDEQSRPERSVRDVLGHFENVAYKEGDNGEGYLEADVVILPDKSFEWARGLMRHAVNYSAKYPDKDFIGLSINANGDSEEMSMDEFAKGYQIPDSAIVKLNSARESGVDRVRVVKNIHDAVSCDLVTEAGAGGRVTTMLEGDSMKKKESKPEMEKKEAGKVAVDQGGVKIEAEMPEQKPEGEEAPHADEEQDIALIKKMLKAKSEPEAAEGEEAMEMDEAAEMEADAMEAAREAYEAACECGHKEGEEAEKAAASFMKMARHMASKHEAKEAAAKEEMPEEKKEEAGGVKVDQGGVKMESAQLIKLTAENAALKESLRKGELEKHIEATLAKSGMTRESTAAFKKVVGTVRSAKEFDEKFALFAEALKQTRGSETAKFSEGLVFATEKSVAPVKSDSLSLADCLV